MDDSVKGGTSRREGIQSVETGMRVLEALVALGKPAALGAVAQAARLSTPQAHRYLRSLIAAGMVRQDSVSGHYDVGAAVLKLGLAALSRIDSFRIAEREITRFSEDWSRTVQVAALGPLGPTIVRWHMGRPPVMTSFGVGSVLSLIHSATGQLFLAFVPRVETDHLLEDELRRSPTMSRGDVEGICNKVRGQGFARVEGTILPGLRATAFPILDLQGRAILSATLVDSTAIQREDDEAARSALLRTCRDISEQLGWRTVNM